MIWVILYEKLQNEIRYQIDDLKANLVRWLIENAAGTQPVMFFDGVRGWKKLGLTRSDPFTNPLSQDM